MSRRGLRTGIITTYLHTWLLQTDGLGHLKISPAIRHDTLGTPTTASVTEVREGASAAYMHDHKTRSVAGSSMPASRQNKVHRSPHDSLQACGGSKS